MIEETTRTYVRAGRGRGTWVRGRGIVDNRGGGPLLSMMVYMVPVQQAREGAIYINRKRDDVTLNSGKMPRNSKRTFG